MEIIKGMVMPRKHGRFSNYSIADQMEVGDCVKVPTQKEGCITVSDLWAVSVLLVNWRMVP